MPDFAVATALALEIARCPEVPAAASDQTHACHEVVLVQGGEPNPGRQVPEAWAGPITTAKVLYLSSNPSISDAGDATSGGSREAYPTANWPDERIADFLMHRFEPSAGWVIDERFKRVDGAFSARPVRYWRAARARTSELLGYGADPARDYAMTEIVHCKSKMETGVAAAANLCAARYLDRTTALCPAAIVVVVGSRARQIAGPAFGLPSTFGNTHSGDGSIALRPVGGRQRLVIYLPHFSGMAPNRTFTKRYGLPAVTELREIAHGRRDPDETSLARLRAHEASG